MPFYTPVPDKIVNGNTADADDIANELNAVAQAFGSVESELTSKQEAAVTTSKTYTDEQLQSISVDGGTY